jgi:hypothetical protein
MFGCWLRALLLLSLSTLVTVAPVRAAGPSSKFKIFADDPNDTMTSPDQQLKIEQYSRSLGNAGDVPVLDVR